MTNFRDTYYSTGVAAAKARNQNDEVTYKFERDFFLRMKAAEPLAEDQEAAQKAYDEGWEATRNVPKFEPFR